MRNRRRLVPEPDGTWEIWPAFTDVMSTLALILFVIVLLSYVRSLIGAKQLDVFQHRIASSERQLRTLQAQVAAEENELGDARGKMQQQQATLAANDRELGAMRDQLQAIAVLRVSVLEKLKHAIEAQLGAGRPDGSELVTVSDTGNIVINERLVFEYDSYEIKKEARPLLDALAKALGSVLDDPDVRGNIDTIVIQGHTDERGSASLNWDLSAKRATSVLDYLFEANDVLARSYGSYFAASAYSKFRPINEAKTEDAYQQNRRIEIAIVPKDDNVRKVIDDYLRTTPAAPPAPSAP